jgi:hypothetical protein
MTEQRPIVAAHNHYLLTVDDFLALRKSGAFAAYSKAELLDGELWGVPRRPSDEPQSDAVSPIKLNVQDFLLLDAAGTFESFAKAELIEGDTQHEQ